MDKPEGFGEDVQKNRGGPIFFPIVPGSEGNFRGFHVPIAKFVPKILVGPLGGVV